MRPVSAAMPRGFLLFVAVVSTQVGRHLSFLDPCYSVARCGCVRGQSRGPAVTSPTFQRILPIPPLCLTSFSFFPVSVAGSSAADFQAFCRPSSSLRQCVGLPSSNDAACAPSFRHVCKSVFRLSSSPLLSRSPALDAAFRPRQCNDRPSTVVPLKGGEPSLFVSLHPRARTSVSNHGWSPAKNTISSHTGRHRALSLGRRAPRSLFLTSTTALLLLGSSRSLRRPRLPPPFHRQDLSFHLSKRNCSPHLPLHSRSSRTISQTWFAVSTSSLPHFFTPPLFSFSSPSTPSPPPTVLFQNSLHAATLHSSRGYNLDDSDDRKRHPTTALNAGGAARETPSEEVAWPSHAAPPPGIRLHKWALDDDGNFKILQQYARDEGIVSVSPVCT